MRIPKSGERGFTLIELLIVVAILGVLAAVIVPNVGRFFGKGETEARRTEYHNISTAVISMMVDNGLTTIPAPVVTPTENMTEFPDTTSSVTVPIPPGKVSDLGGNLYTTSDKPGYLLYGHDIQADNKTDVTVNYVNFTTTKYKYLADPDGTVHQYDPDTGEEYVY